MNMNMDMITMASIILAVLSFLVFETRNLKRATLLYALQTFVLVAIFLILGMEYQINALFVWSATAFVTKVVLVPWIILNLIRKTGITQEEAPFIGVYNPFLALGMALTVALILYPVFLEFSLIKRHIPLAVSIMVFMMGIFGMVFRKSAIKQILSYCLFENGAHLTLALTAYNAPETVEIGILTDAIFAVVIMAALGFRFFRYFGTLDTSQAKELKG